MLPDRLDPQKQAWMQAEGLDILFAALAPAHGEARFVGGAVRDSLMGLPVDDVDLAVNLLPEKTMSLLQGRGLKVLPTGIAHGTLTVVLAGKGYEITSLRRDMKTDGRHAQVSFTDDWEADAARRDFTFNALYVEQNGLLHDYYGGREDLEAGHVAFIGDPLERLREDILRLLRFFRFYAWIGKGQADDKALAACKSMAPFLPRLSSERVGKEIKKLLAAPNPAPSWRLMQQHGILQHLLPQARNVARLEALIQAEPVWLKADPVRRLAALLPADGRTAIDVAQTLRFSSRESVHLRKIAVLAETLGSSKDASSLQQVLYDEGAEVVRDAVFLRAISGKSEDLAERLSIIDQWKAPHFPICGADILKFGVKPGPEIGRVLRVVEDWWRRKGFKPGDLECLAVARRVLAGNVPDMDTLE